MCRTKTSEMKATLQLLSAIRKLGENDRRAVLDNLSKAGVHALRSTLANCIDADTCGSEVAKVLSSHLVAHKKDLVYLSDFRKPRPTKLNRARLAGLGKNLDPILDASMVGLNEQIATLTARAAKAKATADAKKRFVAAATKKNNNNNKKQ